MHGILSYINKNIIYYNLCMFYQCLNFIKYKLSSPPYLRNLNSLNFRSRVRNNLCLNHFLPLKFLLCMVLHIMSMIKY
ncbi:hypothetical protein LSO2F_30038 [Candidatus Liberibacter solanacearum]